MSCDDIPENNVDKFIKVRPLYNSFLKRCKEFPVETNLAADEQMVKFKGKLGVLKIFYSDLLMVWFII